MRGAAVVTLLVLMMGWVQVPEVALAYTLDDFFSSLSNSSLTSFTVPTGTQLKINRGVPVIARNVTIACARPSGCQLSTIGSLDTFRADTCRVKKVIRIFLKNFAATTLVSGTLRYGYSWETPVVGGVHIFFKCRDGCAVRSCQAGTCISGAVPLSFSCKCNSNAYKDATTKTCAICPMGKNCCSKMSCGLGTCHMSRDPWMPQCRCNHGTIMNAQGLCRAPEQALRDDLLDPTVARLDLLHNLKLTSALPTVRRSLMIVGAGGRQVIINGTGRFPIFRIDCPPDNSFFPSKSKFQSPEFQTRNLLLTNARGGAINHNCGTLIISNSSIRYNAPHAIKSLTTLTIKDSSIVENRSPAGAVSSQGGYFSNVRFLKNMGVAVRIAMQPFYVPFTTAFHNCSFVENKANANGAAVHLEGLYWTTDENYDIRDADFNGCRFVGNVASGRGGAISGEHAFLRIRNSLFLHNFAESGGAIWGILKRDDPVSSIRVKNSTFLNNTALTITGGGAIKASTGLDICHSTFIGNKDKAGTPSDINSLDKDASTSYLTKSVIHGCPTLPRYVEFCDIQAVDPTCYGDISNLLQNGTCSRCSF